MLDYSSKRQGLSFFVVIGLIGLFAVLAGFAKTFIMPVTAGSFKAPAVVYIHGAFAFCWIILFITQAFLIHIRKYHLHAVLGILGCFIALGTAFTMLPVGKYAVDKEMSQGLGEMAYSTIFGVVSSAIMFLSLVIAGILFRNNPAVHKRLMLLATIVLLWPAWFRFRHYFPSVPRPDIWFAVVLADSLILLSWIRDKIVNGKVHPVLLYVGGLIIAEHIFEVIMFDSPAWRVIAKDIYQIL